MSIIPIKNILQPYLTEDATKDTSQNEDVNTEAATETEKTEDPSEEEVVEYPDNNNTEHKETNDFSYYMKKFIFSCIVLTFVGIGSFILYKKRT